MEIDPETGETALVRYVVVDDVGTVINPLLLKGQIHGGVAQGLGQVFGEEIRYDDGGADPDGELRRLPDAARLRPLRHRGAEQPGAHGRPTRSA